ncbi:MAG: hypothetical protein ACKVT0_05120 [Planctomycetaceae bacterium]
MTQQDLWDNYLNLPADAQQQVTKLIADLQRQGCCSNKTVSGTIHEEDADIRLWQEDADYFESIRSNLWNDKDYRGKYVALREKEVIDVDDDKFQLARRVMRQYPADVVFVAKVQIESQVVEVPSPEIGP